MVERVTNAIDAVIEKEKEQKGIVSPKDVNSVLKKAYPKYYENRQKISSGETDAYAYEADNKVVLAINDCARSDKPTFDVIDKGTGLPGDKFESTILSLNRGNKLSSDKGYLIGAFGQGGSTSLAFAFATIIISKFNGKYYFTIVKRVDLKDYKNFSYVYLTIDNKIPELKYSEIEGYDSYIEDFIDSESGTLIRMIETDISKQFRENEITKPGMLHDYINTELFNVGLPVKLIENRKNFAENAHIQNRNAYGSYSKLQTWNYVKKDYCGTMKIEYNDNTYKVDYYTILPNKEEDWGRDSACKKTFEQFNVYLDPFIYTVNGQTIATEGFTRLKNAGFNFLRYRLLVVIDLDVLGIEKYKFFTTDRSQIKDTDDTKRFLEKVIKELVKVEKLKEMNTIISEKAINNSIDNEIIEDISNEVKGIYNKFLRTGLFIKMPGKRPGATADDEEIYLDHIEEIKINSAKEKYFIDQSINIILETRAQKHINKDSTIFAYDNGQANYQFTPSYMNGRIQYSWDAKTLGVGSHAIQFKCYLNDMNSLDSNVYEFEILDEKSPDSTPKQKKQELNLKIMTVDDQELICDIDKNVETGEITAKLCLKHEDMMNEVFGHNASAEEINSTEIRIIKPIVLYALFMGETYDKIEKIEDKNRMIVALSRTLISGLSNGNN